MTSRRRAAAPAPAGAVRGPPVDVADTMDTRLPWTLGDLLRARGAGTRDERSCALAADDELPALSAAGTP
ncbi:uncharacterized protein SOCEGT47_052050 [Sorangium cellulosum]|uniref:Uncharacterized protein n=1 Tax=Sorangium cellulosum TaxID=56 RepID=A0A4P2Q6B9_SORCE|nr:uncharacterized protein SOCEGT47_052050 [Sorangium cellulosum]